MQPVATYFGTKQIYEKIEGIEVSIGLFFEFINKPTKFIHIRYNGPAEMLHRQICRTVVLRATLYIVYLKTDFQL